MTSLTPCNKIDKPLNSSCIVLELLFTETSPDDKEHLRQLLQTVSPSKMLAIPLCLDALFGHFKQAQINQVQDASQKVTLHRPNSITKADGLFKYIGNRA